MKRLGALAVLVVLSTIPAKSGVAQVDLVADLTIFEEPHAVIPTTTSGDPRPIPSGMAQFVLAADRSALMFTAIIHGIDFGPLLGLAPQTADTNDDLRAAHIHASPTPFPSAPVVWGFLGTPFNDTDPTNVMTTLFASGVGATITGSWDMNEGNGTTLTEQLPNILAGNAYINFHTAQYPAGEIRGALSVVPEPMSLVLLGTGLVGMAVVRRRRSKKRESI